MNETKIQVVDENDNPVRGALREEVWQKGLFHRMVRIMVEDGKGNILLQKRPKTMQLAPGKWDNSAGGHVDEGETYIKAARRELKEELGKSGELEEIGKYKIKDVSEGKRLNRFNKVYRLIINYTPKDYNRHELDAIKWFSISRVKEQLAKSPEDFTDGIQQVMERYY
jgi:16S rRNA (adenine1518-N6/adenine1519-N6)-dimethyltransferase